MISNIPIGRRLAKLKVRGAFLGAVVASSAIAALGSPAAAAPGTPTYPDMRMIAPTELHSQKRMVNGALHHQVHFTTTLWNAGQGALEIQRIPDASGIATLSQRIYESPAGFRDETIGSVVFDPIDFTFPMPDIARYELWTERAFNRAQARDFKRGQPLYVRENLSHCLADVQPIDPDAASVTPYVLCTKFVMGVSVGWADRENWFADEQSVDFGTSPPPDGDYVVRAIVDPDNLLFESDGKADPARESWVANSGVAYFRIVAGQLAGVE